MVDALGRRQLKGGLGFIDLLEIRLQESPCYAAAKHRFVGMGGEGTDEIMFRESRAGT
jgi:hypothetical protein